MAIPMAASVTEDVYAPLTRRAASTSRANRARKRGSAAYSSRITFIATRRPVGETARKTRPMPPDPRSRSTT
ncbi:hypothetical protein ACLQ2N_35210 [Streptomyces sp. DT224]|uniref:hypothetical protein n=1 Tax=Streptomyces sp. DT224 TaxID=3393426 RepID=UPI003CE86FD7